MEELSRTRKPSTIMWSIYSMLKSTINVKHGINISTYPRLQAFLKRKSDVIHHHSTLSLYGPYPFSSTVHRHFQSFNLWHPGTHMKPMITMTGLCGNNFCCTVLSYLSHFLTLWAIVQFALRKPYAKSRFG